MPAFPSRRRLSPQFWPQRSAPSWGCGHVGQWQLPRHGPECLFCIWVGSWSGIQLATGTGSSICRLCIVSDLFALETRSWLIGAIPGQLRAGITAGIGLFLAMIGLQGMGLLLMKFTLVTLGSLSSAPVLLSLAGLLVMAGLEARGTRRHSDHHSRPERHWLGNRSWRIRRCGVQPPVANAAFALDF